MCRDLLLISSIPDYENARELVYFIRRHLEHKKFENPNQQQRFIKLLKDYDLNTAEIIFPKERVFEMMQDPTFGGHDGKIQHNMLIRFILMFMLAFKKLDIGELYRFNTFLEDAKDCDHPVRESPIYRLEDGEPNQFCLVLNKNIDVDPRWKKLAFSHIYATSVNQMMDDAYLPTMLPDFPLHCCFGKYITEFYLSVYNIEEQKVPLITRCDHLKASSFKGHFPDDENVGIYLHSGFFKNFSNYIK